MKRLLLTVGVLAALIGAAHAGPVSPSSVGVPDNSGGGNVELETENNIESDGTNVIREKFSFGAPLSNGVANAKSTAGAMPPTPTGTPGPFPTCTLQRAVPNATPTPAEFCMVCAGINNVATLDVKFQFGDTFTIEQGGCTPWVPARNTVGVTQGGTHPNVGWPLSCNYIQVRPGAAGDSWDVLMF